MERSYESSSAQKAPQKVNAEKKEKVDIKARVFYVVYQSSAVICKNKHRFYIHNWKGELPEIGDVITFNDSYCSLSKLDMEDIIAYHVSKKSNNIKAYFFIEEFLTGFLPDSEIESIDKIANKKYNIVILAPPGEYDSSRLLQRLEEKFRPDRIMIDTSVDLNLSQDSVASCLRISLMGAKLA